MDKTEFKQMKLVQMQRENKKCKTMMFPFKNKKSAISNLVCVPLLHTPKPSQTHATLPHSAAL